MTGTIGGNCDEAVWARVTIAETLSQVKYDDDDDDGGGGGGGGGGVCVCVCVCVSTLPYIVYSYPAHDRVLFQVQQFIRSLTLTVVRRSKLHSLVYLQCPNVTMYNCLRVL